MLEKELSNVTIPIKIHSQMQLTKFNIKHYVLCDLQVYRGVS